MCINFFWQSDSFERDSYSFILANNRDEYWDKPTKGADFWGSDDSCISALDETPGKEGGTWLGMNKNGKVATLVNILGQKSRGKQNRGFLVSNYITSSIDMYDYALSVEAEKAKYCGFSLLLFDLSRVIRTDLQHQTPVYISNATVFPGVKHMKILPTNKCIGVSNSPMEYPFQKVESGEQMFRQIVKEYPNLNQKKYLTDSLLHMLSNPTRVQPDRVLEKVGDLAAATPEAIDAYSAINIYSPEERLGTRTSTIILVDSYGKVDFVEKNYNFSSNPENPDVTISHKSFSLTPQ